MIHALNTGATAAHHVCQCGSNPTRSQLGFLPVADGLLADLNWKWILAGAAAIALIAWLFSGHSSSPVEVIRRERTSRRIVKRLKEAA